MILLIILLVWFLINRMVTEAIIVWDLESIKSALKGHIDGSSF